MPKVVVEFGALTTGLQTGLNRMRTGINSVADRFGVLGKTLNRLGPQLAGVLGVGALTRFTKEAINTADATAKMAKQVAVSTEFLSTFQHAAGLSGVELKGLQTGLKTLAERTIEARDGIGEGAKQMDVLGVSVVDAAGRLKSTEELIMEVADAFAAMEDGAVKTNAATRLLGRSGMTMIPLLNEGSAGIRRMQDEARALGLEISSGFAANSEQFNDNLTRIQSAFKGVFNILAEAMLPALNELTSTMVKWQTEAGGFTATAETIRDVFRGLVTAVDYLWQVLNSVASLVMHHVVGAFTALGQAIKALIELSGLWVDNLKAVFDMLGSLIKRARDTADVMSNLVDRNFVGAALAARRAFGGVGDDLDKMVDRVKVNTKAAAGTVLSFIGDTTRFMAGMTDGAIADVAGKWERFWARSMARFSPAGAGTPGAASGTADGGGDVVDSAAAEKMQRDLDNQLRVQQAGEDAARVKQEIAHEQRLSQIDELVASTESKNRLVQTAEELHAQRLVDIDREATEKRLQIQQQAEAKLAALRDVQLSGVQGMFANMAIAAEGFGREGFIAYKAFASAVALIDTYKSAVAAYSAVVGIPYVGPALAPIAAAAAVAAGIANVAAINMQSFATGGVISGPEQLIRVNEQGTEGVVNARGMRSIGASGLAAINSGLINAMNLAGAIPAGIAAQMPAAGSGGTTTANAGDAGGQSGPFTFILVDSRATAERYLASMEGRAQIVNIMVDEKTELGLRT